MTYTFTAEQGTLIVGAADPETFAEPEVEDPNGAIARALLGNYGAIGNVINLESVSANDVDAALRAAGILFDVVRSPETLPIKYPNVSVGGAKPKVFAIRKRKL